MMLDKLFQFSTNQQVLTSAVSTNFVNVSAILRSLTAGHQLFVDVNVTETFDVGTPGTDINNISFALGIAANPGAPPTTLLHVSGNHYNEGAEVAPGFPSGPYAVVGDHIYLPVPPFSTGQVRYLQTFRDAGIPLPILYLLYTVTNEAGSGFTQGSVSAALCQGPRSQVGIERLLDAVN